MLETILVNIYRVYQVWDCIIQCINEIMNLGCMKFKLIGMKSLTYLIANMLYYSKLQSIDDSNCNNEGEQISLLVPLLNLCRIVYIL